MPHTEGAVALRFTDEHQGAFCCALVGNYPTHAGEVSHEAPAATTSAEDEANSRWSTATLEYPRVDEWTGSEESEDSQLEILESLRAHREVFTDTLLAGLPLKRPHDHHILLVPGKLPAESAIYRVTSDQLNFPKEEIAKLSANG